MGLKGSYIFYQMSTLFYKYINAYEFLTFFSTWGGGEWYGCTIVRVYNCPRFLSPAGVNMLSFIEVKPNVGI